MKQDSDDCFRGWKRDDDEYDDDDSRDDDQEEQVKDEDGNDAVEHDDRWNHSLILTTPAWLRLNHNFRSPLQDDAGAFSMNLMYIYKIYT